MYLAELVIHSIEELKKNSLHTGRTNIQKMIFFSIKDIETLRSIYQPYHYGPFSEKVQLRLQDMENVNFIEYGADGYSITDSFRKDQIQPNDDEKYKKNISHTIEFLQNSNITKVNDIAAFSKVYYYVLPDPNKEESELVSIIKNNAPFVWPSLMDYGCRFPKFIQLSKQLNSELQ